MPRNYKGEEERLYSRHTFCKNCGIQYLVVTNRCPDCGYDHNAALYAEYLDSPKSMVPQPVQPEASPLSIPPLAEMPIPTSGIITTGGGFNWNYTSPTRHAVGVDPYNNGIDSSTRFATVNAGTPEMNLYDHARQFAVRNDTPVSHDPDETAHALRAARYFGRTPIAEIVEAQQEYTRITEQIQTAIRTQRDIDGIGAPGILEQIQNNHIMPGTPGEFLSVNLDLLTNPLPEWPNEPPQRILNPLPPSPPSIEDDLPF